MKDYKKELTKIWSELFPEFKVYKPLWLVKKVDCFIFGVFLKYSIGYGSPHYIPNFHVHNLSFDNGSNLVFELNFPLLKSGTSKVESLSVLNQQYDLWASNLIAQNSIIKKNSSISEDIIPLYKKQISNYATVGGTHPGVLIKSLFHLLNFYNYDRDYKLKCWEWCEFAIDESKMDFIWVGEFDKFTLRNYLRHLIDDVDQIPPQVINERIALIFGKKSHFFN